MSSNGRYYHQNGIHFECISGSCFWWVSEGGDLGEGRLRVGVMVGLRHLQEHPE